MADQGTLTPLKRFFNLLEVDKQEVFSVYLYAIFNGIVTLSLPIGIQAIINLLTGGQVSTSWIVLVAIVIAGVALTGAMQIMQLTITENLQQKLFTRSAFEFAYRIPRLKLEAIDKTYIPELVNRFFDTQSVQKGLSKILIDFSSSSLQIVFGLVLLSVYHPFFILFSLVLVLIVYLIFRFTVPRGMSSSIRESKHKYEVAHWLEELARAMETFKLAGKSSLPLNRTDEVVERYLQSRKVHFRTLVIQYINLVGFKVIVAAGLLLIGGLLVLNQQMNIGQFVASEIIIILVINSVEKLILSVETIYDVLTSIEKIGDVTDVPLDRDSGIDQSTGGARGLSVKLDNISYRFPDARESFIRDISLSIMEGEKVCLSGYNGSGKSFLLQLIAGLYENFEGSVSYDNVPFGNWRKGDLHALINDTVANEDIFLGSIAENITLGREGISSANIQEALDIVGLNTFISSLPEGYSTMLFPEGKNLPESVRLRLILARSIVGNPKLILLDDGLNHLSEPDQSRFLDHLLQGDWTVLAVSNQEPISSKFDRCLVLENGQLLATGTIDELKMNSWYKDIFQYG